MVQAGAQVLRAERHRHAGVEEGGPFGGGHHEGGRGGTLLTGVTGVGEGDFPRHMGEKPCGQREALRRKQIREEKKDVHFCLLWDFRISANRNFFSWRAP